MPTITADRDAGGDIHIVLGPHYAMAQWIGKPNVIRLDRCFYGDTTQCARVGWLHADGSQTFARGYTRPVPAVKDWRTNGNTALILADWGQSVKSIVSEAQSYFSEVRVRLHPANKQTSESLSDSIARADAVIGTAGTAQIQAILDGVPTTCLDPRHIARPVTAHVIGDIIMPDRSAWLRDLAYAQWSHDEMKSGEAWEYLNATDTITRYRAGH